MAFLPIPRSLFPAPLRRQCRALLAEYLPSPAPLFHSLEQRIPQPARQLAVELPLNQLFADAISDGEFEVLEGRTLRLELDGGFPGITLGYWQGRFRQVEGRGEATIRGSLKAFRQLAERKVDPDQLFFQRRLVIEGDTELGLTLKNLLDGLEWSLPQLPTAPWR
ncbi:ubiquinone anaerobic biosynthesis accessory factor UbiT [Marinobacter zhejiangensis]|uniref:Ubiquinone biosynthesis accessory factor UbiT n=1 Tax=Marinobacter zhejiangensis TaxID=488535 RepID=A0A1I4SXX6_9GAMM|nr:SCP2 sterol-binding domain-containing protein [Marinobacter zhejiangensis]SFM69314.1 Predicted lipid carrier protein YhbT, contains SCP2 domain [Marinobacter zhejiangensis]